MVMPAIPVMQPPGVGSEILAKQGIFERGDHIYLTTPVQLFRPTEQQIEEFAFSGAVKQKAPNENIVWFKGQYVEADNPNGNGATWRAQELAIKSLTPMLMPVTVMHDPRTAVGTIADVKLLTPAKDQVPRARIDTVLALWGHRFPEAVHEAEANAAQGTLMQSMECYSPWYECSECGSVYHKLPYGAEQATWCEHLKASNPSAGFVDLSSADGSQTPNASRILGDVCFTGTGLIFGTRGARGAYSEAYLENFQDELAQFHHTVHTATATSSTAPRSERMGLVQIEQSELDTLRKERDDARAEAQGKATELQEAQRAAETAEAAKTAAETKAQEAEAKVTSLEEQANRASLKDTRMKALGAGFTAKLGDFTKGRLDEQAGTMSDEDWENRLKELEEVTAVKRDAKADGSSGSGDGGSGSGGENGSGKDGSPDFSREELARMGLGGDTGQPSSTGGPSPAERASVVGSLAGAFKPKAPANQS